MPAVYLHIPFCRAKCPYCDFYSLPASADAEIDAYVALLCQEIRLCNEVGMGDPAITSLFLGGGTPSLLSVEQLSRLLDALVQRYGFVSQAEISMEVNPGTVTPTWLREVRALGINRLSIGVQSFQDDQLRWLGRIHDAAQALGCIEAARSAGFDNLSLDLMFALPTATVAQQQADREWVARLAPEHCSVYGLTVEEGTPLADRIAAGDFDEVEERHYCDQFLAWHETLAALGYEHYEISNYARPGLVCRHNLSYWLRQPCLGLGAGAHSFLLNGWGERKANGDDVAAYRDALVRSDSPRQLIERFTADSAMREWTYLRLRTRQGVCEQEFQACFGRSFADVFATALDRAAAVLSHRHGCWSFTPQGWLLFNHYVREFL
ncbi:MAG: radical SAM family heme chaperone HemW [Desulfuromonadaceae bacterium]|nr:radical SAM family heme chaperone HemW [Desulfuromonadaceae bacterium]